MKVILNKSTDPYFNLALEEYLLRNSDEEYFMLWRNRPSIIVGRNQNTLAEINREYVSEHKIPVVRRQSGGGAVFHDLGNINYTFISNSRSNGFSNYELFCRPIIEVLHSLGVNAVLSGRNDLLIDGKKFSGNAQCAYKNRLMHHGTLMFCADVSDMTAALNVNPLKIQSKGIKSVRSRVTNISEHLPEAMDIEAFCERIVRHISADGSGVPYELSEADIAAVRKLVCEKYSLDEWNYGFSKDYSVSKQSIFPCGFFDVKINIAENKISDIRIFGDYFGQRSVEEIEKLLTGADYSVQGLCAALSGVMTDEYFSGLSTDELISALI